MTSIEPAHAVTCETIAMTVVRDGRMLVVRFAEPQRAVSWAIVGGGPRRTSAVAWLQVDDDELRPPVDAQQLLRSRLSAAGVPDAVGLLTSRRLDAYVDQTCEHGDLRARCVTTVGLGNALRAGDAPGAQARIGTINTLCWVSCPLSSEALLEALALAAEARSLAVREADVPSTRSGEPASGTGTDCIVVAAPDRSPNARYAGKHTALGHVIGAAVYAATRRGAQQWKAERALLGASR
jgi:adenosylcobinamide amidohydrolase